LLETEQNTVKIGDLFLRKICWNWIETEGKDYLIMREDDILAII
jgi:co-chaperonin GroES (HSP10)